MEGKARTLRGRGGGGVADTSRLFNVGLLLFGFGGLLRGLSACEERVCDRTTTSF